MTEFTNGIFNTIKNLYLSNRGSILRTIIYTIGHVSFIIAMTDAIVEPIANSIWYFVLDKYWTSKTQKAT